MNANSMKLPAPVWPTITDGNTRRSVAASRESTAESALRSYTFIIRSASSPIRARASRKHSSVTSWNGTYGPP